MATLRSINVRQAFTKWDESGSALRCYVRPNDEDSDEEDDENELDDEEEEDVDEYDDEDEDTADEKPMSKESNNFLLQN